MEARQEAARDEAKLQHEAAERAAQRNRVAEFSRRSADAEHERAIEKCYSVCFHLAKAAYGVVVCAGWPDLPQNQKFLADWPTHARGGRPSWWAPPPGMLELAAAELRLCRHINDEPDWAKFLKGYTFGTPWPWRLDAQRGERPAARIGTRRTHWYRQSPATP